VGADVGARIVFDQTAETWLRLHGEAFEELGGVVEVVVPDNLEAAVIRAAFGIEGPTALNRSYRELARQLQGAPRQRPSRSAIAAADATPV
jgi:transposase